MVKLLLIILALVFAMIASSKKLEKYCWFAYFIAFSVHVNIFYIYNYPHYVGKQNMGIAITLSEVIGLGILLSNLLRGRKRNKTEFKACRRYFIYVLFSFCSLFYSYNKGMSINEIGTEVELLLVIFLVSAYFKTAYFKYFKSAVLLNSYAEAALCVFQMFTGVSFRGGTLEKRYGVYRTTGLYITPSELAIVALISFFFLYIIYLQNKSSKERYLLLGGMACNIISIIVGQSRTGFLIFAIGLILIALMRNENIRTKSKSQLRLLILIGVLAIIILSIAGEIDLGNSADMYNSRLVMWGMGIKVFLQHPIIGVGNNAYTAFNSGFSNSVKWWEATNPVHNIYIMELAETGLIGFSLLFINFYFPIARYSFKKSKKSIYYEILFIILFLQLLYGFTGWVFYSQNLRFYNMLMFTVLLKMGDYELAYNDNLNLIKLENKT